VDLEVGIDAVRAFGGLDGTPTGSDFVQPPLSELGDPVTDSRRIAWIWKANEDGLIRHGSSGGFSR
jgi:hypothetical protein